MDFNIESIKNTQIFKYLKHNLKDSIYSLLNLLIASLDGFFLSVLLVRFLSVEDLGNYKLFFSILNILIILSINGLNTSVSKAVAKRYKSFFVKATKISVSFACLGSLVLVVLGLTYYRTSDIKYALLFSAIFIPIYFGFNTWESFLYGEREFRRIFLRNLIVVIVRFGSCAAILYFFRDYLLTIITFLLVVTITNTIFFLMTYKRVKNRRRDKEEDKEYVKHGFRLTGASAVSVIAKNIERIILDAVSNATMVGYYSIVAVFPNFIKNGLKNLVNVPTVKLAAYTEKENRRIIKKGLALIFLFGVALVAIFWFVIPILIRFFYKVDDPQILLYGRLMLLPLLFMPVNLTIKYMASYQGSGKSVFKLYTTVDIMKLALLAIFVPLYKIEGIIIALILAEVFSSIILIVWFFRSGKKFKTESK